MKSRIVSILKYGFVLTVFHSMTLGVSFADNHIASTSLDDLMSFSIEDLMNIKVKTASKKIEKISGAPGIISVITSEDIKTYGAKNIKDVISRIPSLLVFDSSTFTASGLSLRAGATQHLNNHVLLLLNDRPLRESQNGGLHTDINLLLPVDSIERIEVIRGPGSVLYGSNSFSGTINFITKKNIGEKSVQGSVASQLGTDEYFNHQLSVGAAVNKDSHVQLFFNHLTNGGETVEGIDEANNFGQHDVYSDGYNLLLNGNYKNLSFSLLNNRIDVPILSGPFNWNNEATFELERTFFDVAYHHNITNNWKADLSYTSNLSKRAVVNSGGVASSFKANGYTLEWTIKGDVSEKVDIVGGIVYDQLRGDLGQSGGDYDSLRTSYYLQADYHLTNNVKVITGAQVNRPEGRKAELSPRLGLISQFNKNLTSKLLYSEAFRSPYGSEMFFDAAFLKGDPNLESEKIKTFEAQLSYGDIKYLYSLTYYHSRAEGFIGRAFIGGVNSFVNESGHVEFDGLEFEAQQELSRHWKWSGSLSLQENENENGEEGYLPGPRWMLKLGLSYLSENGYRIGVWNNSIGEISKTEDLSGSTIQVVNPRADTVHLLSLNLHMELNKLFNLNYKSNPLWSFYINNILDEDVYFPEIGRRKVNTYPQSYARSATTQLKLSF